MASRTIASTRLIFPALLLVIGGCWQGIEGIAAIVRGGYFVAPPGYAFSFSIAGWGWVHLIVGVFAIAVGIGLVIGHPLAWLLALILASASLISNFLWLPIEPGWSVAVIALDVLVIWSLSTARDRPSAGAAGGHRA